MATSKNRIALPSMGTLILLVFFISFSVWAFSECSARRAALREGRTPTAGPVAGTATPAEAPALPRLRPDTLTAASEATPAAAPAAASRLYVTIDGLNLRKEPGLSSPVIAKLPLFDEVYYDEAVTDSTFLVNLGKAEADEPYVRVRTKAGTRGWVYGAGVNYYRRANPAAQ